MQSCSSSRSTTSVFAHLFSRSKSVKSKCSPPLLKTLAGQLVHREAGSWRELISMCVIHTHRARHTQTVPYMHAWVHVHTCKNTHTHDWLHTCSVNCISTLADTQRTALPIGKEGTGETPDSFLRFPLTLWLHPVTNRRERSHLIFPVSLIRWYILYITFSYYSSEWCRTADIYCIILVYVRFSS